MNNSEIGALATPLAQEIEQTTIIFQIPFYQRKYSWRREQVTVFLQDVLERMADKHAHYFGTMAITQTVGSYQRGEARIITRILDGQQRLTTAIIFLKVAHNFGKLQDWTSDRLELIFNTGNVIGERYLNDSADRSEKNEFINILSSNEKTEIKKEWQYSINYHLMLEWFNKNCTSYENWNNAIETFAKHFTVGKIKFEASALHGREMDIFESLNSKGTKLTEWDLIRNYIFSITKNVEEEKRVYLMDNEFVNHFVSNWSPVTRENELNKFMTEMLYFFASSKNKSDFSYKTFDSLPVYRNLKVYFNLEGHIENEKSYIDLMVTFKKFGVIYRALLSKEISSIAKGLENIAINLVNIGSKQQLYFLVFKIFDMCAEFKNNSWIVKKLSALELAIKTLDIFIQRYEIVNNKGTSWRVRDINWAKKLGDENFLSSFFNTINDNIEILDSILYDNLCKTINPDLGKNLLQRVQYVLSEKENKNFRINHENNQKAPELEHVMPKNNEHWAIFLQKQDNVNWEQKYELSLESLGNYYVIPKGINASIKNNSFSEKKNYLLKFENMMPLIKGDKEHEITPLKEIDSWTFETIENRTKALANFLVHKVLSTKNLREKIDIEELKQKH